MALSSQLPTLMGFSATIIYLEPGLSSNSKNLQLPVLTLETNYRKNNLKNQTNGLEIQNAYEFQKKNKQS